ncbi:MFS transporter [Acinetobacter portensis]|uniref:MFS transporter n=3 Tax=Moraxellaceae TaxID=468 RepID=A0A6L6GFF5_9GAMM|nr:MULTISPECIES: MFS transporter [Acinetobacter]MCK7608311.1 MFS transporter [Acinetobacter portensis]MCK7639071.1 MFS transporter [Acinetobacter portensis]MDY6537431.1 MFS transporter [Acinetobacter faecalis]MTD11219.1 MFS transporter [Acinetobacter faecalis]UPO23955.1 MFS transporter [Acinetobacter portensis]
MNEITQQRLWNKSFILCLFNNLFLFTYYFALLAVLPIYIMKDLGGTIEQAGLALTLFLVSSIAIRPFSGLISQKLGKKLTFRGSELFFVLFALSYLWIDSMWTLLLVRFLHGFWFSILTTVTVPVANDFIPEHRKGEGMGYFVMSTNLGVVIGPLIALTVIQFASFNTLFALLSVLMAVGFIFCLMLKIPEQQSEVKQIEEKNTKLTLHDIIETKVIPVGLVALLTALTYSSILSFITAYSESKNLFEYASIFFIVFAVSMIVVRPFVGKMFDRKGPSAVMYPSFIFFAIGMVLVSFVNNQWTLWLSAVFIGIGYGTLFPCLQTVAIQTVPKNRMGHAISTFFTLFDIGLAVGSIIMGIFISWMGFQNTFLLCSVIIVLTLLVYKATVAPALSQKKSA